MVIIILAGLLGALAQASNAISYNAVTAFSLATNPNGVWSYGKLSAVTGGAFSALTTSTANAQYTGELTWDNDNSIPNSVSVTLNTSGTSQQVSVTVIQPTNELVMDGEDDISDVRFTAPATGTYNLTGLFQRVDIYANPVNVYIVENGTQVLFSDIELTTYGNEVTFNNLGNIALTAGATLDFVEQGLYYNNDGTGLQATITEVSGSSPAPAPSTYNAVANFSLTGNPNGVWSYGSLSAVTGGAFGLLTTATANAQYAGELTWDNDKSIPYSVGVTLNKSGTTQQVSVTVVQPTNELVIDGEDGIADVRFTAPATGIYNLTGLFQRVDIYANPVNVYIVENGTQVLFSARELTTYGNEVTFNNLGSIALTAGATLDFVEQGLYYNNDGTGLQATITEVFLPGAFTGFITGSSGVEGILTGHVQRSGDFTAQLDLEGLTVPLTGRFSASGVYSKTITLKNGLKLAVSLTFETNGALTATISYGGQTLAFSGDEIPTTSNTITGTYPFTIVPSQSIETGSAPTGAGFGCMHVHKNGAVAIAGRLADGTAFSTSSWVTSGSSIPIYAYPYKHSGGEIVGTLLFENVPGVSDCDGTLSWIKPATSLNSMYPQGFELSTQFTAVHFDPVITGLNHDNASFDAIGADLQAEFPGDVTLHPVVSPVATFGGATANLRLTIVPAADTFSGSFEDGATQTRRSFTGILLPKSRSGAGFFLSGGLAGSINITY